MAKEKEVVVQQEVDHLLQALYDVNSAIDHLEQQYKAKPENPVSSVLISLELVKMNLTKLNS